MWLKVKVDNIKTLYQIIKYIETLENTSITIEQSKPGQAKVETPTNSRQLPNDNQTPDNNCCPKCKKPLVLRKGKFSSFMGCTGWKPDNKGCDYTKTIKDGEN